MGTNPKTANRRILIVSNFLSDVSGTHGVCEDLATHLRDAGWLVLTTSHKPTRLHRLADMLETVWQHRSEYDVAQVDVFSGRAFFWAEAVCWLLQRLHKPYVLTLHGGNLPHFARRWPGRVRRLLQSAAAVTVPSGYLLNEMKPYRSDLLLIPNPLDLKRYPFRLRSQPQPRLVWLRAFHKIYNPVLAIEVTAILRAEFPDVKLIMIGPDKGDGSLAQARQQARERNVADHIVSAGKVAKVDIPEWLNKGDIFLNTARVDNTPVSVLEAMACGLCIVSTNVGGVPHLLQDGEDALLVPPDDPGAMAEAIRRILSEPRLAEHLSPNARRKAEQFDWSTILPRWETLLKSVIKSSVTHEERKA